MLWSVIKPPQNAIYWLDDVHKGFYRSMLAGSIFNNCFPNGFVDVLDRSGKTKELFQDVFDAYQPLTPDLKRELSALFYNQINWVQALGNTNQSVLAPSAGLKNIWELVKKLGGYLYSTTLDLTCFKNASTNPNDCIGSHFEDFKDENGVICCFCGTEEMMEERIIEPEEGALNEDEKQWRASYDHYLPKKLYPFLAVDFNNLIPCCQKCNEKAKGELDILHCDGVRTLAFNPYTDPRPVSLEAKYESYNGTFVMKVEIQDTANQLSEKADTWNRTFSVLPRVNKRLKRFDSSWLGPILNGAINVASAKTRLNDEVLRCNNEKTFEREAYYKSLCFDVIKNKSDAEIESYIEVVNQLYAARRI
ncbi:hypothetical protein [Pseudoalteromonas undina]|uniref:hypothetical protein n=1 Tax=Pseudoalteromonas undina TaxID=43660 RepID=UPI001865F3C3|nr:hypothetical protein [Pseudoalteromonas undina]